MSDYFNNDTKKTETTEGFIYSYKAFLMNFILLLQATPEDTDEIKRIGLMTDFTFNLILEGWTDGLLGCRSLKLDKSQHIVQVSKYEDKFVFYIVARYRIICLCSNLGPYLEW